MNSITSFIKSFPGGKVIVLGHKNADVDAVSSVSALSFVLEKYNPSIKAVPSIADDANLLSMHLVEEFGLSINFLKSFGDAKAVFVLDSSSVDMLGTLKKELLNFKGPVIMIDHHARKDEMVSLMTHCWTDESFTSTAEMIYEISKDLDVKLSKNILSFIAAAIMTDSANFMAASSGTFRRIAEVLEERNIKYRDILSTMVIPSDVSQKIAKLKGARRSKIYRVGDFIIATSKVSSFESSVAGSLLKIGADVSFVVAEEKKEIRLSARATPSFIKATSINLGKDIMPEIEEIISGSGGGHAGAAGANGSNPKSADKALEKCIEKTIEIIQKTDVKATKVSY
ncbi:MAG: DHH family phosphoesterase [Candidatus Diapherotrites archaeon]|nr:DHH family phosphoesterase [Candidatus Diapherotrites archaeon]